MEVYLIRHGETGGNIAHRHQHENTPLTSRGVEQAKQVAEKVKDLNPSHLLTSSMVRAIETAREIGSVCDLVPETNSNFVEIARPGYVQGHYHKSAESMMYYISWYLGRDKEGESYKSLRQRIIQAKEHFKSYPEDARVAVVSHSIFINFFLAQMCQDSRIGLPTAVKTLKGIFSMKNTEFIPLIFDPKAGEDTCGWLRAED